MSFFYKFNLDFAGFAASFICAVHCVSLPILMSLGLTASSSFLHNHFFEMVIIGFGVVVATASLYNDFKKHKSYLPMAFILPGFMILIYGLKGHHDLTHTLVSVLGSTLVATAHILNWRKSKSIKSLS